MAIAQALGMEVHRSTGAVMEADSTMCLASPMEDNMEVTRMGGLISVSRGGMWISGMVSAGTIEEVKKAWLLSSHKYGSFHRTLSAVLLTRERQDRQYTQTVLLLSVFCCSAHAHH